MFFVHSYLHYVPAQLTAAGVRVFGLSLRGTMPLVVAGAELRTLTEVKIKTIYVQTSAN